MPKAAAPTDPAPIAAFEHSLDELEQIVAKLEHGELTLDESLKTFERGVALFRDCKSALDAAELKVKQLTDPLQPDNATPFETDTP